MRASEHSGFVARTLWALGYTCSAGMMCAHASELAQRRAVNDDPEDVKRMQIELSMLGKHVFNDALVKRIESLVSTKNTDLASEIGRDLESILPIEHLGLSAASLADWPRRLYLIGDQLDLPTDAQRERFIELLDTRRGDVSDLAKQLCNIRQRVVRSAQHIRDGYRGSVKRNSYVDACALIELENLGTPKPIFFSMTESIVRLVDSSLGSDVLPTLYGSRDDVNSLLDDGPLDRPTGCLRSDIYIVLRAICPSLAFSDLREPLDGDLPIEHDRSEMLRLVKSAEEIVAQIWPRSSAVDEWNSSFSKLRTTWGFRRVWASKSGKSIVWLGRNLPGFGTLDSTVEKVRQERVRILAANLERLVVVEKEIESLYRKLESEELDSSDDGIGRWLLMLTSPFGDLKKLLRTAQREIGRQWPSFSGTPEQWGAVLRRGSPKITLASRCVAAAKIFARGGYEHIRLEEQVDSAANPPQLLEICTDIAMRSLHFCATLCMERRADVESIVEMERQIALRESRLVTLPPQRTKAGRVRCMCAVRAWREFYAIEMLGLADGLEVLRSATGNIESGSNKKLSRAAAVGGELHSNPNTWDVDDSHGVGKFSDLLEWPVLELLFAMNAARDVNVEVLRRISCPIPSGLIAVDARAWRLKRWVAEESSEAMDALRAARRMPLPRNVERYLQKHQVVYGDMLAKHSQGDGHPGGDAGAAQHP